MNSTYIFMWSLAVSMFVFFKLLTLILAKPITHKTYATQMAYLLLWPGMNVEQFNTLTKSSQTKLREYKAIIFKISLGFAMIYLPQDLLAPSYPLSATWISMAGFILFLHCGIFHALSLFWNLQGRAVVPIMRAPLLAKDLREFWGKRWNLAFRDLAHQLIYLPLRKYFSNTTSMMLCFIFSGLVHELVITVPVHQGYGGPTFYFMLQAIGLLLQRQDFFIKHNFLLRISTWCFLVFPLPLLFPTSFVWKVMFPFFQSILVR